jgi:hypothetical protein
LDKVTSDKFFLPLNNLWRIYRAITPEILYPRAKVDQRFHPETDKLEDLVANLGQDLDKLHLQQSVELPASTIDAVSTKLTPGHSIPPSP